MEHIVSFIGRGLLYLLVVLAVTLVALGLQALVRRCGGVNGERLLQGMFAAAIGVALGNAFPALYRALAPWSIPVLGASLAFAFIAMRPGSPARRHGIHPDAPRGTS